MSVIIQKDWASKENKRSYQRFLQNAVIEKTVIAVRLSTTVQLREEIIIHKETEGSSFHSLAK